MAFGVELHGIIQNISPRRFHHTYFLPEQMELFKDFVKFTDSPVVLLVLQNIVSKVTMKNYGSRDIYLICFAAKVDNEVINFTQTLTEKMESHFIINFCHSYLRQLCKDPPPSVIVIQYVPFLLNGVSFAFNCLSFYEQNLQYLRFLLKQVSVLPNTFIQIDILSLILAVDSQAYFKDKIEAVKHFFIKCIIYLSTLDNLSNFEETVTNILILILSPYQNKVTEKHRSILLFKICTNEIDTKFQIFQDFLKHDGHQISSHFKIQESFETASSDDLYNYIEDLKLKAINIYEFISSTPNGSKIRLKYY